MGVMEIMDLHTSANANNDRENNAECNSGIENNTSEGEPQKTCADVIFTVEDLERIKQENKCNHTMTASLDKDPITQQPLRSVEMVESLLVNHVALVDQREERDIKMDGGKMCQEECTAKESSVRVVYSTLPSRSKRKLEELLHHWSEWHAKNCASVQDSIDSLESGEETYFPALHVGSNQLSTVSYSMDVHVRKRKRKGTPLTDDDCSTQYERGYAIGLSLDGGVSEERGYDLREAPRCFNCGSYNHSLTECSKPRDKNAVNSARKKKYQTKRSHTAGPRVPTRYYQESPSGKFDGLKPGSLSEETRKLLGIGECDPPPWLNRMRELGYPPGYFEEENPPSGIDIYEDPDNTAIKNDDLLDAQKSQKKMTVDFPGVNAPIPENADQWLWNAPTPRGPPTPSHSWTQPDNRGNLFGVSFRQNGHTPPPRFGFGLSPPVSRYTPNHHPTESFSPRGLPIPASPKLWEAI